MVFTHELVVSEIERVRFLILRPKAVVGKREVVFSVRAFCPPYLEVSLVKLLQAGLLCTGVSAYVPFFLLV